MRFSRQKPRFRTAEQALKRRDERPFSTRRFKHLKAVLRTAEQDVVEALAERAFNSPIAELTLDDPDGQVTIQLPSGGWARVSPDIDAECIAALDRMMQLAAQHYGFEVTQPGALPDEEREDL